MTAWENVGFERNADAEVLMIWACTKCGQEAYGIGLDPPKLECPMCSFLGDMDRVIELLKQNRASSAEVDSVVERVVQILDAGEEEECPPAEELEEALAVYHADGDPKDLIRSLEETRKMFAEGLSD